MRGTNHVITGVATVVIIDASLRIVSYLTDISLHDFVKSCISWQLFETNTPFEQLCMTILIQFVNVMMFYIGCLLPDCDQPNSLAGRWLYIPVEHRTWTHTIWSISLLGVVSLAAPCYTYLTYGYTLHLFYDSLSKKGVCWFYPLTMNKKKTSGVQGKKNRKIYLYRTGETSETILTAIIVFVGLCMLICVSYLTGCHNASPLPVGWLSDADPK